MSDFVKFLMLLSIVGLLNHVSVQGYGLQTSNQILEPAFFAYPDDPPPEHKIDSLKIYSDTEYRKEVKEDNRLVAKFAQRINKFHKSITSAVFAANPHENVIFSPISVGTLLMMMSLGARGATLREINRELNLFFSREELYGFKELIHIFKNTKAVELNFANQIFVSKDIKIQDDYKSRISSLFDTRLQSINFDNPTHAAELINNWCKKQTKNHITEITNQDSLTDVLVVLANAIYFKGNWKIPFDEKLTTISKFHINKKTTVNVTMMSIQNEFSWGKIHELNTKFFELSYTSDDKIKDKYSMFALIPEEVEGLAELEKHLDLIDFNRLDMIEDTVELHLPKFKIESKLEIKPILQKMGINRMFDHRADFRGMVDDQQLYVSKMVQKAFLEVNEQGSTAAAVSTAEYVNRMGKTIIRADRPFYCIIVLKELGIPLFYAKVMDPSKLQ